MNRIEKLRAIYKIYDEEISKESFFCNKGCSTCCTLNVILTSLEFENLKDKVSDSKRFKKYSKIKRFQPKTTTNMIADLLRAGEEPPSEEMGLTGERCPFLKDDVCSIYDVRPFGCRCMVSKTDCMESGTAEVDPYIITLNNVILQYIEHLDSDGVTGNFIDMILEKGDFVNNRKVSILMVPSEHRDRIMGTIEKLSKLF